ncbi:MAG: acetoacetate decarboxylase family protein [Microthrixaceae bacterium]
MTDTEQDSPDQDRWGEIDGVEITFPIVVDEMNSATLTFTVPADAARAFVPEGFEVLEVAPGSAMLIVALCDYLRNPWGDYLEVNLGLLVHPAGRPEEAGAFQWRMPVDQEFTCAAGNRVLGLPKSVEDLTVEYTDDSVTFLLRDAGEPSLTVTLPRAAAAGDPVRETTITYSILDGAPTAVPLTIDLPTGAVDPAAVRLELGTGVVADELRSLGLPAVPDLAAWGEGLGGTFERPRPL